MRSLAIALVVSGLLAGCKTSDPQNAPSTGLPHSSEKVIAASLVEMPTTRPATIGSVSLLGDIKEAGPRDLHGGEKISDILRTATLSTPTSKLTVVLVRRCPEGTTRDMIDISQDLKVLDPHRNFELRDGDELVVSTVPSIPEGLARPVATDLPPAH